MILTKLIEAKQGNKPKFDEGHIIMALLQIKQMQPVGRIILMKNLGLTEASMKTMLKRLRELELIHTDPVGGNTLTEKGERLVSCIQNNSMIKESELKSLNWKSYMIVLHEGSKLLNNFSVLYLRDEMIRLGADKALICIIARDGKIEIPPKTDEMSLKGLIEEIRENCNDCREGDLITFITPNDQHLAFLILAQLIQKLEICKESGSW